MKVIFMGTPDFAVPTLKKLIESGHEVIAVYTQPDKPKGRKQILTPPPVKTLALENGIEVYQPDSLKDGNEIKRISLMAPDVIVVAAYGRILPKAVLEVPEKGCINVHGSLLPRWRGAAPIQWAVISGDEKTGVTTMQMAEGLDTGDILLSSEVFIKEKETAGELFDRLAELGAELLIETLEKLPGITPKPQDDSKSCYANMLDKELAVIDWTKSAKELECLIRGLNPWPVALTFLGGKKLKIYGADVTENEGRPGEVTESDPKTGITVCCGEKALKLKEVQLTGGKRMKADAFLRGHPVLKGTILG